MSNIKGAWTPDGRLTNAKFEGYKLSFSDDEGDSSEDVSPTSLPSRKEKRSIRLGQTSMPPGRCLKGYSEARLGYKQARSRAKWNHLSPGKGKEAAWISGDGTLWMIDLGDAEATPQHIITLPEPLETIASTSAAALTPEYPTARHLRDSLWACSDGFGQLHVIDTRQSSITATYELVEKDSTAVLPFAFHNVDVAGDVASAIISSSSPRQSIRRANDAFTTELVRFKIDGDVNNKEVQPLLRVIQLAGPDLPTYTTFLNGNCIIGSSARLSPPNEQDVGNSIAESQSFYEPTAEEIVGIPQAGTEAPALASEQAPSPPPPYSWMQSSDSVTLVFALPSAINAKDIKVVFRPTSISLLVSGSSTQDSLPLPHLDFAKLWADIDASSSTWTWEKTGGSKGKFGILSVYLEKRHEGTRWVHVFKENDNTSLEKQYFDVDETLDRSELLQITEAMEKFTADLSKSDASATSQNGFNQRSSLLGQELDMEVDAPGISDGKAIQFIEIEEVYAESPIVRKVQNQELAELVSIALPSATQVDKSIIIKHDVDGMLFQPQATNSGLTWRHTSTFPALAFVLASKRDVVHVYHHAHNFAIGLEAGVSYEASRIQSSTSYSSIRSSKLNAYVYYPPSPGVKDKFAKQKVLSLSDSPIGAVLGAIFIDKMLLILCETELILFPIS